MTIMDIEIVNKIIAERGDTDAKKITLVATYTTGCRCNDTLETKTITLNEYNDYVNRLLNEVEEINKTLNE